MTGGGAAAILAFQKGAPANPTRLAYVCMHMGPVEAQVSYVCIWWYIRAAVRCTCQVSGSDQLSKLLPPTPACKTCMPACHLAERSSSGVASAKLLVPLA
jgi:hypothetical protein